MHASLFFSIVPTSVCTSRRSTTARIEIFSRVDDAGNRIKRSITKRNDVGNVDTQPISTGDITSNTFPTRSCFQSRECADCRQFLFLPHLLSRRITYTSVRDKDVVETRTAGVERASASARRRTTTRVASKARGKQQQHQR
jgi:hypothetical protein